MTPGNPNRVIHHACRRNRNMPYLFTIRRSTAKRTHSHTVTCTGNVNNAQTNVLRAAFQRRARASLFNRRMILYNNLDRLVGSNFRALIGTNCRPRLTCFRYLRRIGLVISLIMRNNLTRVHHDVSGATRCNSCAHNPHVVASRAHTRVHGILGRVRAKRFTHRFILRGRSNGTNFATVHHHRTRRPVRRINGSLQTVFD